MFTKQDKQLIKDLGIRKLSSEQQIAQLSQFYETLDIKVGMALEARLTATQIKQFEKVNQADDDVATEAWLHHAIPEYDQVVAEEMATLKAEIQATAKQFKKIIENSN